MIGNVTILAELVPPGVGKKFEPRPQNEVLTPLGHACQNFSQAPLSLSGVLLWKQKNKNKNKKQANKVVKGLRKNWRGS